MQGGYNIVTLVNCWTTPNWHQSRPKNSSTPC
jgi:hypothetical protein